MQDLDPNALPEADTSTEFGLCAATPAPQHDLTSLVVPLLKGVLYRDDDAPQWSALLQL